MVGYVSCGILLWWGMFHAVFYYGGVCFIMVGMFHYGGVYVSLWWGMFHYGRVCFIMVGYVSLWSGMFHCDGVLYIRTPKNVALKNVQVR